MLRLLMVCVFALLTAAAPAHAITSTEAIARLNALRAEHGLPALAEDVQMSRECQAHARYMALNGGWDADDAHDQTPGRPGYSEEGARAARRSVLAGPGGWLDPHPWVGSPQHLQLVMDPELEDTGYGEHGGWVCLQVAKGPRPDLIGRVFTLPGPGATLTAPPLVVFTPGADVTFHDPQLIGPDGTVGLAGSAPFLRPTAPLARGTTYTAEVDLRYPATNCSRAGAPPVHPQCPPRFAPWCYASQADFEPDWLPAEADPYDPVLCAPGQRPPATPDAVIRARSVPHHWQFATPGPAVLCPAAVTAPTRLAVGATLRVHVRPCGATAVTAELFRGSRRVIRRPSRLAAFRVSTRALKPGRYRLRVTVGERRFSRSLTVRR
jgi:hypothetical protein